MGRLVCFIDNEGQVATCINYEDEGNCDNCNHNNDAHKKWHEELNKNNSVKTEGNKKVKIVAQAFDPDTGLPLSGVSPKPELIDPNSNKLFKDCKTLTDFAETYMAFWNRLPTKQSELVLVQSIEWW